MIVVPAADDTYSPTGPNAAGQICAFDGGATEAEDVDREGIVALGVTSAEAEGI
ncbi:MAG: hypothetical protein WBG53_14220 [Rhodococcus sp. (in: high G+C Gram-positive bacteria)]|uniref:hypothetical protein n=1 Tax=unclassified Rhodococcus (in: high G+C Gram-positive bacteria) TaxID=192944 RepID=UPI000A94CEDD|nr:MULTISPECIES: hypothetical protein [unclassified Rhodococcus (in: high G+C Gram-positive bacteria)]